MVRRDILPNGTRLLVQEMHAAPVVALSTWIPTGAADDPADLSGISHFLEHMLFKDQAGAGESLTRSVQDAGGYLNARTGYDHTAFYQVVSRDSWRNILKAQVTALAEPMFGREDVEAEREVIIDELRRSEGDPQALSWRRLMEGTFAGSAYGRPVAGTSESLGRIGADELIEHFRAHYAPDNRICVIVGDVDADEAVAQASSVLGGDAVFGAQNDAPAGEASVRRARPRWNACDWTDDADVSVPYLILAFEAPDVLHVDVPPLDVLCGLAGLGRSSRLKRVLQTSMGIVSKVSAGVAAYRDTGVVAVQAVGTRDTPPEKIVEEIARQLRRLKVEAVQDAEMVKSVRRLEAGYALEHETVESVAMTLGFFELLGDHQRAEKYVDMLAAVTPGDLLRVAAQYLEAERVSISAIVPRSPAKPRLRDVALAADPPGTARTRAEQTAREASSGWTAVSSFARPLIMFEGGETSIRRVDIDGVGRLVVDESHAIPVVSVALGFAGGFVDEPDGDLGLTKATLHHMLKGSRSRPGNELTDEMEALGSGFSTSIERDGFGLGASVLSAHLKDAVEIIFDVVLSPTLDENAFDTVRSELLADIGEDEDNASTRTALRLLPMLFPDHPYGRPISGTAASVTAMPWSRTAPWHRDVCTADKLVVSMSGDVNLSDALGSVSRVIADMRRTGPAVHRPAVRREPAGNVDEPLPTGGPSTIALGFPGPRLGTPEAVAMHVLASTLTMMGGRLWKSLREGPPYAYSVRATPLPLSLGGAFVGHVTAQPGSEEVAVDRFIEVIEAVARDGLSDAELTTGQRYLAGMMELRMQRSATRAAAYAMAEVSELGYERVLKLPDMVRAVTNEEVVSVARTYLTAEEGPAVAILRGR